MAKAAALICASEWESFGLTIVEAIVCGCVPISVDCPHAPRDILDGGRCGYLVDETPEAIADAMHRVLTNPGEAREKLAYGRRFIERYDIKNIVAQWETLLKRVAYARYVL